MKRWTTQILFCGLILGGQAVYAGDVGLADWCLNVNGDINVACNGGTGGTGGLGQGGTATDTVTTVSLANLDLTLEPGANTLGYATINFTGASNAYVALYADYDVSYATWGSFDDSASVHGTLPSGVSYQLGDPNVDPMFSNFSGFNSGSALPNTNTVATPAGPDPGPNCCDVSTSLGLSGLNGTGTVTFTVSNSAPVGDGVFYLQQTNQDTGNSIYISVASSVEGSGAPEPSTFGMGLIGAGIASVGLFVRRRARQNS